MLYGGTDWESNGNSRSPFGVGLPLAMCSSGKVNASYRLASRFTRLRRSENLGADAQLPLNSGKLLLIG